MDNARAGARPTGLSLMPPQAGGDSGQACPTADRPLVDSFEAAFDAELADWLVRLYAVRAHRILMRRLARIYGIGWLLVTTAIVALPMVGLGAVVASVLLLITMLAVAWTTGVRNGIERRRARRPLRVHGSTASSDFPLFGTGRARSARAAHEPVPRSVAARHTNAAAR